MLISIQVASAYIFCPDQRRVILLVFNKIEFVCMVFVLLEMLVNIWNNLCRLPEAQKSQIQICPQKGPEK